MPKEIQRGETRYIYQNKGKQTEKIIAVEGPIPLEFALEQDAVTYIVVVACRFSCVVVAGTLTR